MVKPLLRSGVRSHYLALGENGQLVFDSALQIREALRLRGLQAVADCLAIPQCHHEGERIDWYAPRRGAVTPWASANASLRQQALDDLLHCRAKVEALRICRMISALTLSPSATLSTADQSRVVPNDSQAPVVPVIEPR